MKHSAIWGIVGAVFMIFLAPFVREASIFASQVVLGIAFLILFTSANQLIKKRRKNKKKKHSIF